MCWSLFLAAIAWPTFALLGRCLLQAEAPQGGFGFSGRQFGLLWRSVWLSSSATALSLVVSIPGAYVVGSVRRVTERPLIIGALMLLLLTPPMVCAFGWERLLPAAFDAHARCITLWALWLWPISALIIGVGWSRSARDVYEAATLVTSRRAAFVRVALPQLASYVVVSSAIVFVLCLRDYGVPHASGLLVFATELLGWARDSTNTIDTVWPSMPVMAIMLALVTVAWRVERFTKANVAGDDSPAGGSASRRGSRGMLLLAVGCFIGSWLIPVGALTIKLASYDAMAEALRTYGRDLAWSLALGAGCGLAVALAGSGWMAQRRYRLVMLIWALAFGVLPGALVGESMVAAYNFHATSWLYDHWPVVALSYVARFAWIGFAAGFLVRSASPLLEDQADTDGASFSERLAGIYLPLGLPVLLCAAAIVMALSLGETEASAMVRVPSFSPISHVLIEKFHRFEYGMLVSLSLWLVAAAIVPAGLLAGAIQNSEFRVRNSEL